MKEVEDKEASIILRNRIIIWWCLARNSRKFALAFSALSESCEMASDAYRQLAEILKDPKIAAALSEEVR